MILKYISSNGQVFDFKGARLRTRAADFHDYAWTPQTVARQFGVDVNSFKADARSYTLTATAFGTLAQKKDYLNLLHAAFDADIRSLTPGRLVHGAFYIDCYMTQVSTTYEEPWTQNTFTVYCPRPFWVRDDVTRIEARDVQRTGLGYPYGYDYDLGREPIALTTIENLSTGAADFTIRLHGSTNNPVVYVDGREVGVWVPLGVDEYAEIDTAKRTVTAYLVHGEMNAFNLRTKNRLIFDPLSPGKHTLIWSGEFAIDFILHEERSEPLWI